jgi:hypothetical protein
MAGPISPGRFGASGEKEMTSHEHRERHKTLHVMFDELLGDFISHTGKMPSETSLTTFMQWSHQQTIEPDEGPPFFNKPHPYPK